MKQNHQVEEIKTKNRSIFGTLILLLILVSISFFQIIYSTTSFNDTEDSKVFNLVDYLFDNSLTSMLLSTGIIGVVGILINKLRGFKKKLDMVEILAKSLVVMKRKQESSNQEFKETIAKHQLELQANNKNLVEMIEEHQKYVDKELKSLEVKIGTSTKEVMDTLFKYFLERR